MALPVVQAFPLQPTFIGCLAAADGRQKRQFSPVAQQGVEVATAAVHGHGEAKLNPLFKAKRQDEVSNRGSLLHGLFMMASTQLLGNLPKGHHVHGMVLRRGVHGRRLVQGFMNAIPFRSVMVPALQASGLWKLYQAGDATVEAVRGVELTVPPGDMVAVMGPSGCGKTTLLNILSGIDEPTAGTVFVNGEPLYGISDNARTDLRGKAFGFIFQDFNLLPVLSAVENVELPLLLLGSSASQARHEALEALQRVGLSDRADHRPSELSGGQQQRVAVARAIVHRPSIILCDEPTGNLDTGTSGQVMDLLRTMNEAEGTTFLIVTHDETIANQCRRTVVMNDGLVVSSLDNKAAEEE